MIKVAALVVGGTYAFRRFTEGTAEQEKRSRKIAPLGQFVIAWGVVFFALSIMAPAAPSAAGNMALLVMIASLLANGVEVSRDLRAGMNRSLAERDSMLAGQAAHRRGRLPYGKRIRRGEVAGPPAPSRGASIEPEESPIERNPL
jgi:hypothetical protein